MMRELLVERLEPVVHRFAKQLAELYVAKFEAQLAGLADVFELALSSVASDLSPSETDVEDAARARRPSLAPAPEEPSPPPAAVSAGARAARRCTKCREPGHRADRCPTIEARETDAVELDADDDAPSIVSPPPPSQAGPIASPRSKPRRVRGAATNVPPLGWTPELDREDEHRGLHFLTLLRKAR